MSTALHVLNMSPIGPSSDLVVDTGSSNSVAYTTPQSYIIYNMPFVSSFLHPSVAIFSGNHQQFLIVHKWISHASRAKGDAETSEQDNLMFFYVFHCVCTCACARACLCVYVCMYVCVCVCVCVCV